MSVTGKKISALDPGSLPLTGTEIVPIIQGGANKIVTAQDISNLGPSDILGAIAFNAPAPTPAKSGKYSFTTGGSCTWLTGGAATVAVGDEVVVVYTAPSTYTYTKVGRPDIEQVRSQSTSKVPSSKLVDDQLNYINKVDAQLMPVANYRNGGYAYMNGKVFTLTQNVEITFKSGYITLNSGTLDMTGVYRGKYLLNVMDGVSSYNLSDLVRDGNTAPTALSSNVLVIGYCNEEKMYSTLLSSSINNYLAVKLAENQTALNGLAGTGRTTETVKGNSDRITVLKMNHKYPFQEEMTESDLIGAIKDVRIYGGDKTKKYRFDYIIRNDYSIWRLYMSDDNGRIAEFNVTNYVEPSGIDLVTLNQVNSSGVTAKVWVNWSEITSGFNKSGLTFEKTGLISDVIIENYQKQIEDIIPEIGYPFNRDSTKTDVIVFVHDVIIYGADKTKKYWFDYIIRKATYNIWRVYLRDDNGQVAAFNVEGSYSEPSSGLDELTLVEMNGSGITAKVWVDWTTLPLTFSVANMTYEQTGLSPQTFQLKQVENVESQIQNLANIPTLVENLAITKTGKAENFMKTLLADRQVVKIAYFGDSIFFSGFGVLTADGTKGFATQEYDHFASRTLDFLNYNKPIFRGINHAAWTLANSPTTKNAWSPYNSRNSGIYSVLNTDTKTAQINGITGHETIVFVFEGGQSGNATYDTGIAKILVSTDGGSTWDTPTNKGLLGGLTKYGFGSTKVYNAPIDEFDTAFSYPQEAYLPLTDNVGTAPIREVTYQLNPATTYSFKIQRKAGETSPVHFWGCYYFTGQTVIPINVAWPGASWNDLRRVAYNLLKVSDCQYAITEAPMWHDFKSESNIRIDIQQFISEVQKWGIEVAITSCPPAGVICEPFVSSLGDEEPAYYPGENTSWIVNHRKAVNLNATPAYADYPDKGSIYRVSVGGVNYNGTVSLTKPDEADFAAWTYRQVLMMTFEEAPENPDLINADYNLTLTKQSGTGAASLTATSVYYLPPAIEAHREIVKSECDKNNVRFIDILDAYERVATSVGEAIDTDGYPMNVNHPWFSMIDTKARKVKLSTTDGITMPNVGDVFSATINAITRHFQVSSVSTADDYIELMSIDGGGQNYIYPGDMETISNRNNLFGIVYTKVSGSGSVNSFTPIGIYSITDAVMPITMNYMSNYFSRSDGHHLDSNSIDLIFGVIKEQALKNSIYKIN